MTYKTVETKSRFQIKSCEKLSTEADQAQFLVPVVQDASYVYTSDGTNILRMPKSGGDGGAPQALASAQAGDFVVAMAVDETRVFWTEQTTNQINLQGYVYAAPATGGNSTLLASYGIGTVSGMFDIVVDTTHIYWTSGQATFTLTMQ